MENMALLRAASFSSSPLISSSLPRFRASMINRTGWRRTIRMVTVHRIAMVELFAICIWVINTHTP